MWPTEVKETIVSCSCVKFKLAGCSPTHQKRSVLLISGSCSPSEVISMLWSLHVLHSAS